VTLGFEVDDNLSINVNRDRIKQMLINLIDNAIKYNSENGYVLVKICKQDGKIIFTIKDSGIGIAEEHISRIFERFYRVDKGRSRNMGGTGLGLSIVKHIVNLYSGSINVKSEPGKGSEFIIQLPD
jgi:two-component system phosphate regulon sensor histidine kinase PhoR